MVAPRASAIVVSIGLVCPSPGRCTPPTTSDTSSSGQRRAISLRPTSPTSSPNIRAIDAPRRNSSRRSALVAIDRLPRRWNPVACPVSASSEA